MYKQHVGAGNTTTTTKVLVSSGPADTDIFKDLYEYFWSVTSGALKFTEPAESPDWLPDAAFGEYIVGGSNVFYICQTEQICWTFFVCVITASPERIGAAGFPDLHQ